jgi:hypothetical protein
MVDNIPSVVVGIHHTNQQDQTREKEAMHKDLLEG